MAITVKILKRSADGRPTLYATRDFEVLPVSIGRDAACSICLEDPYKHMSRIHAEITEESGGYAMTVVSKVNPVMSKGRRIGPGARLPLQSGDSFEIAEYEVQVLLPERAVETSSPMTPGLGSTTAGGPPIADSAERLFNESTFLGGDEPTPTRLIPSAADFAAPEETFVPNRARAAPPAATPAATPAVNGDGLRAFLDGAGVPPRDVSAAESERMLHDGGAMLQAAIQGIMLLMATRAETRKAFDERPSAGTRDNNPLKRMSDPQQAMDFLFDPGERTEGLLDPVQAVADACQELRTHQLALLAGMRAAVQGAVGRLEPGSIERAFDSGPKAFSLASRKARLWELFVAQQGKLSREARDEFHKAFGADFMAAYQAELKSLKAPR